jgi:glutathione S-transferase
MTLELYVFPPSPRAFKTMAVANHLGIDFTMKLVDLTKGGQREVGYVALNPNMRMPTLKDGDYVLWESEAILQYLAGKKPESGLLPTDERARMDVTRWQFWNVSHWDPQCAIFIFENLVKPQILQIGEPDKAAIEKGEPNFHRAAGVLDAQLKGKTWVTGETLTIADFSIGACMIHAKAADFPLDRYEEIKRWYARLSALPGWQKTLGSLQG